MKVLVAYYSRTGRTAKAARELSGILGCDSEEIVEGKARNGLLGYLKAGLDGATGHRSSIHHPRMDASEYDLVIVGTPIWAGRISSPMRTYLNMIRSRAPSIALMCTTGGSAGEEALEDFEKLVGSPPIGSLCLRETDAGDERTVVNLRIFVDRVLSKLKATAA